MRREQLALPLRKRPRRGGRSAGAGRKRAPGPRPSVAHRARPSLDGRHPVLVTLRALDDVRSLRTPGTYRAIVGAFGSRADDGFRIVHFSVQTDHVHMIVEATDERTLSRGMRSGATGSCRYTTHRASDPHHADSGRPPL